MNQIVLTPNEMAVYKLVVAGHNNQEISQKLNISDASVRKTLKSVYSKINCLYDLGDNPSDSTVRSKAMVLGVLLGLVPYQIPAIEFVEKDNRGRKPIFDKPMTEYERVKRSRQNKLYKQVG